MTKHVVIIGESCEMQEVSVSTSFEALLTGMSIAMPVLIGGVCGEYADISVLRSKLVSFGYQSDSVRTFSAGECIVEHTEKLYKTICRLSCSMCVLCREGSWQISAIFDGITKGKAYRDDLTLLNDICPIIKAGALCEFGRNMVNPALSVISECFEELTEHIAGKRCPSGQCRDLMRYVIDPALCIGCGECIDVCPEDIIEGKEGFIHMIDERCCKKCGKCEEVCTARAVAYSSEKMKVPVRLVRVGRFRT
jgi:NADH-quinone oxidoreductase subunit F